MSDDTKLTGDDLEQALTERGLPSEGTADDKRAAVEAFDAGARAQASSETGAPAGDPNEPVRVKMPNGMETTLSRGWAESEGLDILDKPATGAGGVHLPAAPSETAGA